MELMGITDIDEPIQFTVLSTTATGSVQKRGSGPEPGQEQVDMLCDMGFSASQARKALRETVRFFFLCTDR